MSPILPLALALLLQALPAPGSLPWEEVSTDQDGRNAIDPGSLRRTGDVVRFTMRVIFHNPAAFEGMTVLTMRMAIDCQRRTFAIEAADGYGGEGQLLRTREVAAAEAEYLPLTSLAEHETIRRRVCGPDAA